MDMNDLNNGSGGIPPQDVPPQDVPPQDVPPQNIPPQQEPVYGQPVYGQPAYGAPQPEPQPKGLGIASMVCGIVSLVVCCCEYISIPLGIVGLVLGIIALKKGCGKGFAIAGIACSGVSLAFIAFCFVLYYSGAVDTTQWEDLLDQLQSMAGSEV